MVREKLAVREVEVKGLLRDGQGAGAAALPEWTQPRGRVWQGASLSDLTLCFLCPAAPPLAVTAVATSLGTMPPTAGSSPAWVRLAWVLCGGSSPSAALLPLFGSSQYPISSLSASLPFLELRLLALSVTWLVSEHSAFLFSFFIYFLAALHSRGILVLQLGIKLVPPAMVSWILNRWTTR